MSERRTRQTGTGEAAKCGICSLGAHPGWGPLRDACRRMSANGPRGRRYPAKTMVYGQGEDSDGFYVLTDGMVLLMIVDARGNSTLVRTAGPGEAFGFRSFLAGESHSVSAHTVTPSRVCFLPRSAAQRIMEDDREIADLLVRRLAITLREANEALLRTARLSVRERLIHLLLSFAHGAGAQPRGDGSVEMVLPVTRTDIAGLIGTAPEHLSRIIRRLQQEGLAHFERDIVHLPAPETLHAEISTQVRPH